MELDNRLQPDEAFPYPSYRDYQEASLYQAAHALWNKDGIENVILNLPTGIGKSAINTALARQARSAFVTTPQKALRTQLEEDEDLREYYSVLRSRSDYNCVPGSAYASGGENYDCEECPINQSDDDSCIHHRNCNYWTRKQAAIADPVAVLTFSYLIIDNHLPVYTDQGNSGVSIVKQPSGEPLQVSFDNRELLIVDECHKLEDQVASLHAGITISLYSLPAEVFQQVDREVGELPEDTVTTFEDVREKLDFVYDRASGYIEEFGYQSAMDEGQDVRDCRNFKRKYEWCREQVQNGRDWVVDREEVTYGDSVRHTIQLKPVDVDHFLSNFVWSRAQKRVLSTATMPFSGSPARWIKRLGLKPEATEVVQHPMPFPTANRPIDIGTIVGKMSQGGYWTHRDEVVDAIRKLSDRHKGEKGLVHTASYDRAEDLYKAFPDNGYCHRKRLDQDLHTQIERWQESNRDIFFSPSATEGVDLPGEKCRWQVLVKVPYPQPNDPRVKFLLDKRKAWDWYYEVTAQEIQQSVGRGVRRTDDECIYYVLDYSFQDVMNRASIPDWFSRAIGLSYSE